MTRFLALIAAAFLVTGCGVKIGDFDLTPKTDTSPPLAVMGEWTTCVRRTGASTAQCTGPYRHFEWMRPTDNQQKRA